MTFSITAPAVQEILAAAVRSDAVGMALRVAAQPAPDGMDYGMGFDEAIGDDEVTVFSGLTVVVAARSRPWLEGTVLDYVEIEPGRHDFIFVAPARPTPGCGSGGCSGCSR